MAFLRTLGRIGDTIGDVLAQAVVGPDYKTKARFLARQKILEMQDAEENLMTKRSLAQQRKLADVKNLIEFATQGANVSETSTPTGSVIPPKISEGMDGALEAGPSTDVMSSEITSQVPDLPEGVTDPRNLPLIHNAAEQESIRRYRKQQLAQLNQESMTGSREAQAALAQARTRAAQSGKPLEEELAQATLDLRRAQTARAGRAPMGASPSAEARMWGVYTDAETGEAVRVNRVTGEVAPLEGIRTNAINLNERVGRAGNEDILSDIDEIDSITNRNPGAVGIGASLRTWIGQYTDAFGGADPDAQTVQTKIYEGLTQRLHEMSGAAVTPQEAARLLKTMPRPTQNVEYFRRALQLWKTDLMASMRAYQLGAGTRPSRIGPDASGARPVTRGRGLGHGSSTASSPAGGSGGGTDLGGGLIRED